MRLLAHTKEAGQIWSQRALLHPNMGVLSDKGHAINPLTFVENIRNKFFLLDADLERVERAFVSATNRGSRTLNFLLTEHLKDETALRDACVVGPFPETVMITELIQEARRRYRALQGVANTDIHNRRSLYEVVRGLEVGYQVLRIDTEKEVHLSLRHYREIMEWFSKFLGIGEGKPCSIDLFDYVFPTNWGVEIYGQKDMPFRSRLKFLTRDGEVKYASLLMKRYLNLLEDNSKSRNAATRDYTGVEFIVSTDQDVENLVNGFRETGPTWSLESFKQRRRAGQLQGNLDANSAFGLTKFIIRIPVLVDEIPNHPLGDMACQLIPVEVQILTLEDQHIRSTHPDASHDAYKNRQFRRLLPALFPIEIYKPFLPK